jgi:hypothetical protein
MCSDIPNQKNNKKRWGEDYTDGSNIQGMEGEVAGEQMEVHSGHRSE